MNKTAIQRFAIWARTELIAQVSQRAYQYGITKDGYGEANAVTVGGRALSTDEQRQRKELVEQIRRKGYTQVMEEVAYTWFNRFIALRFMEVNNYLPSHIRVFSNSTGAFKPEILNDVLHLDLPGLNKEKVSEFIESNQTEALYRYLLLTQCNALNDALPQMFEKMGGYTELLLPNNILKQDSILGRMVTDIPEEDWMDQVQIIGWLYQYYNSELKDDTFALLKKNVKITKERIPSATQLFTPDWIVRYMVENSLGRIFIDKRKNEGVFADGRGADEMTWEETEAKRIANEKYIAEQMGWKYYLPEAEQTKEVRQQLDEIQNEYANLDVKEIKVIDPCMGSGHILVYAFDVLMQIYEANGYSQRDAAQSILENNLYGLDIDDRAAQLAYFAVMMKARQYDRRIFSRGIQPHVHSIMETNALGGSYKLAMGDFLLSKEHQETLNYLLDAFLDAKEYGSILQLEDRDYTGLMEAWKNTVSQTAENVNKTLWYSAVEHEIPRLIEQAIVLSQKYDVVVTNPPYMGNMPIRMAEYVKKFYAEEKYDLYSVFMKRCVNFSESSGLVGMITQQAWMFLSSFEKMRVKLNGVTFTNLVQLGSRAFEDIGGEVVQTVTFTIRNCCLEKYRGLYKDLTEGMSQDEKKEMFFSAKSIFNCQKEYQKTPGNVYAFSMPTKLIDYFEGKQLGDYVKIKSGIVTGNNDYFLKLWYEIGFDRIRFDHKEFTDNSNIKWVPMHKGGGYRKHYGLHEYVMNLHDIWEPEKTNVSVRRGEPKYYFKEGLTWSTLSNNLSVRKSPSGFVFDTKGSMCFVHDIKKLDYIESFLNSKIAAYYMSFLSPTLDFNQGTMGRIPLIYDKDKQENVVGISEDNVKLCSSDWDSFETSWDFQRHPFIGNIETVAEAYAQWEQECEERFNQLQANEEELNRIFIDIYGLQDELTPEVEDKDVTVRKADLGRDIRSLISYAVGCLFGRYSLDMQGLAYAGGEWDASKYSTIIPDTDNIIPICDDDYFDDDITGRFVKWVETVYGKETLEENLRFIADALGGKGTPRKVIRHYFINDFYADHLKIYQKRPIYWLFDSGKKNGFKALIYMHRYQRDLLARMRTDYVHEQQERYRTQLSHLVDAIDHASASERVKLTKQQKKIQEQALEILKYEEKIHHLADQNISIDLDDGVKHNYELFADVLAKIK